MFEFDEWMKFIPYVATGIATIMPLLRSVFTSWGSPRQKLEDRYRLLVKFFEDGGIDLHPIQRETLFGAALGHANLTATEIPLLLRQQDPTSFIVNYLRVRSYLAPNSSATKFELKSIAAKPWLCHSLKIVGFLLYVAFAGTAAWLIFYGVSLIAQSGPWREVAAIFITSIISAAFAALLLFELNKLNWAVRLYDEQREA